MTGNIATLLDHNVLIKQRYTRDTCPTGLVIKTKKTKSWGKLICFNLSYILQLHLPYRCALTDWETYSYFPEPPLQRWMSWRFTGDWVYLGMPSAVFPKHTALNPHTHIITITTTTLLQLPTRTRRKRREKHQLLLKCFFSERRQSCHGHIPTSQSALQQRTPQRADHICFHAGRVFFCLRKWAAVSLTAL